MVSDSALFTRNTASCPNKLKPRNSAPGAAGKLDLGKGKGGLPGVDIAQAIAGSPVVQGVSNHITAATSKINALP